MIGHAKQALRALQTAIGTIGDAASITGSALAQLRFIGATGIPVTSAVPGTGATNLGKTVGDTTGTHVGVAALGRSMITSPDQENLDSKYCFIPVSNAGVWTVGGVKPLSTWVVDGSLAADYTSSEIDAALYPFVALAIQLADNSAGTLHIQQSNTSGSFFEDITIDANRVEFKVAGVSNAGVAFAGPSGTITITDPGGATFLGVNFVATKRYVRLFFDRSGGDAAGIDAQYLLRAAA